MRGLLSRIVKQTIYLFQCNLVYFTGRFDIGVSLHGCGAATDLVMQCCLHNYASFVICPCCYGKIRYSTSVTYPRSSIFRGAGLTRKVKVDSNILHDDLVVVVIYKKVLSSISTIYT